MIVSDSNALNSYLRTPPYFSGERGVNAIFEIAPARMVPSVIQERETEHEVRWAEERRGNRNRPREAALPGERPAPRSASRHTGNSASLPELRLARPGQAEIDPLLSSQVQIRTRLAHSGYLPRQWVVAGGHAFDSATQARATLNVSKVHRQRKSQAEHAPGSRRSAH